MASGCTLGLPLFTKFIFIGHFYTIKKSPSMKSTILSHGILLLIAHYIRILETNNLVSRLVFFVSAHPDMIYLFNYTEYYCFTFTSDHFRVLNLITHATLRIKVNKKNFPMYLAL
jgi:hypothetical protein